MSKECELHALEMDKWINISQEDWINFKYCPSFDKLI